MAFIFVKSCHVCKTIRKQGGEGKSDLLKRIYNSRHYDEGGESLKAIAESYPDSFGYLGLLNHAKKHQALTTEQLADRRISQLSQKIEEEKAVKHFSHHDVRGLMRDLAGKQLESGEMRLSAAATVAILKQDMEMEEKNKDRQLEVLKMIAAFQSGAVQREEIDGPVTAERNFASGSTGSLNSGL